MAPYTNMPDDVKDMAEETEAKIKSGENCIRSPAPSTSRTVAAEGW